MSVRTKNPNKPGIGQRVIVASNNGMPVDSYVTIEATRPLHKGAIPLPDYTDPTVTVPSSVDLDAIKNTKAQHSGQLVLQTFDGSIYFIGRKTINNSLKTFRIYNEPALATTPEDISVSAGWMIAEAKLVNKLATTSAAHIDEVEFNGFGVSFSLNGATDSVSIFDGTNKVKVNPDGSINVVGDIEADVIIDAEQGDTIAISRHAFPFEEVSVFDRTAAQLDVEDFTQIYSYSNSLEELRIQTVKVDTSTFGLFQVKVNGVVKDRFRTSPTDRNCIIQFTQEIDVPQGQTLSVEFVPERLLLSNYNFMVRLEGYQNLEV